MAPAGKPTKTEGKPPKRSNTTRPGSGKPSARVFTPKTARPGPRPPAKSIDPDPAPINVHPFRAKGEEITPGTTTSIDAMAPPLAVERMAGIGLALKDIALVLGISQSEVEARYTDQIRVGRAKANLKVSNAIFETATDRKHPKHAIMAIFWAKVRMGWVEATAEPGDMTPAASADEPGHGSAHLTNPEVRDRFSVMMKKLGK